MEKETNLKRPVQVVSIDHNCMTCAPSTVNELTVKAFKMACLQYQPSKVFFENCHYNRKDLIDAKEILLKYCLSQLTHLDLGILDSKTYMEQLD